MLKMEKPNWNDVNGFLLEPHHHLGEAKLLFDKMEDEPIQKQIEKLHGGKSGTGSGKQEVNKSELSNPKSEISYDDFSKMELKVGTIEAAEKVAKADKLLQLKINLGNEVRTVVSGIAEYYSPEKIIGQQVCVVANLAPRKIKGIESKGMILMAEDGDGKLRFVMPSEKISD